MNNTLEHKTWPPSCSASGDNAYYLPSCEFVARSPAYASCLFKIAENQAGRSEQHPSHRECCAPIEHGRCRALGMRQEEDLQGVALYYVPRQKVAGTALPNRPRFDLALPPMQTMPFVPSLPAMPTGPRTAPAKPTAPVEPYNAYAAAINAALRDTAKPTAAPTPVATIAPLSGLPPSRPLPVTRASAANPPPSRPVRLPGETPLQYARRCASLESTMNPNLGKEADES